MGSKVSKAKRSTPTKTKAVIVPRIPQDTVPTPPQDTVPVIPQEAVPTIPHDMVSRIPQDTVSIPQQDTVPVLLPDTIPEIPQDMIPTIPHDIISEILDHLASASDLRSLRACALVSKPWVQPCQRHLFHTAIFTPASAGEWLKTFPVREDSPAHHVRDIRLEIGQTARIPERFFECIPWFADVDKMTSSGHGGGPLGYGGYSSWPEPSFWKLPRSVTSLSIKTDAVTLMHARDIMAQLPNLDDLVISYSLSEVDRGKLPGIGTVLKGRFGGRLILHDAGEDVVNMLLEIPSGLHFAGLEIHCTGDRFPCWAVRVAEACCKTLVKLSYTVGFRCEFYPVR